MANFNINIVVKTKGATAGTKKVEKGLNRVRSSADRARGSLGRMFSVLVAARAIKSTVSVLAEYSDAIQTIAAVTGAADVQLARLNETAKQLGITTSFTATQAAEGLTLLARAGFDVDESLTAIAATLNLAKAGNIGLAQATEIAANTLRAFRFEAEEMTRVVDVLAKTANVTNTTIVQLGQAMKFAAPVAKGLGVSLETTSSALGILANAGQKASLGGTGLRRVLASLESPTAKARKALKGLGLNAADVQISAVGLQGALDALAQSGASVGEIFEIFGRRSGTSAAVLIANAESVKLLDIALKNAAGTAARMAEVMDRGLGKALLRVKSAIQGSIIELGDSGVTEFLIQQFDSLALRIRAIASNMSKIGDGLAAIGIHANMTEKALRDMEKNSRLNELGARITHATREMNNLNRAIAAQESRGGSATAGQVARLAELRAGIEATTAEIKLNAKASAELQKVREAGQVTADNLISRLAAEAAGLADLTNETKIQAQAQREISRILLQGGSVTAAQRESIVNALKEIDLLKEKRAALESIVGPQKKNADQLRAFKTLLDEGTISIQQFTQATEGLTVADPFKDQADSLALANEQLRIMATNTGIQQEALLIELQLRQQGKELTDAERDSLAALLIEKQKLTQQIQKQADAEKKRAAIATKQKALEEGAAKRELALVKQLDVTGQLLIAERELLALREKFPLLADEINTKLEDMQLRSLEASTGMSAGFERAFIKMRREAEDFAAVGEGIANVFADQATDALIKFAETGKFHFKSFAADILKDITRIIARLLVMQAISATLGGVGGGGGAAGGQALTSLAGRASGGAVQKDRSFIVGENGPELFTPQTAGNVSPAGTTAGMKQEAPQMTVQVVNVDDPDMVPQSISDGSSDEAIINVLSRNRDKLRGIL